MLAMSFGMWVGVCNAQVTAMDFQRMDCNGNMQHLYADLDAGNAVILEFFMQNCTPCINAGNKLEMMKSDLLTEFPGKVKSYAIGYTNSYSCASNLNWVTSNGFTSIPMDSGATQVAYYGGFGMPTIVILGGTDHRVLGSAYIGFTTSDTTQMASDIRAFLSTPTGTDPGLEATGGISLYPNPTRGDISLSLNAAEPGSLSMEVMDLAGRKVMYTEPEMIAAGPSTRQLKIAQLPAGTYLLRTNLNGALQVQRFTVAR